MKNEGFNTVDGSPGEVYPIISIYLQGFSTIPGGLCRISEPSTVVAVANVLFETDPRIFPLEKCHNMIDTFGL